METQSLWRSPCKLLPNLEHCYNYSVFFKSFSCLLLFFIYLFVAQKLQITFHKVCLFVYLFTRCQEQQIYGFSCIKSLLFLLLPGCNCGDGCQWVNGGRENWPTPQRSRGQAITFNVILQLHQLDRVSTQHLEFVRMCELRSCDRQQDSSARAIRPPSCNVWGWGQTPIFREGERERDTCLQRDSSMSVLMNHKSCGSALVSCTQVRNGPETSSCVREGGREWQSGTKSDAGLKP